MKCSKCKKEIHTFQNSSHADQFWAVGEEAEHINGCCSLEFLEDGKWKEIETK